MKKVLLLLTVITLTSCGPIKYIVSELHPKEEIVIVDNTKDKLFVLANEWMVEAFKSAEDVIQFTDKDAGIVKGKYTMKAGTFTPGTYIGYGITTASSSTEAIVAIITIRVKDGAAKITIEPTSNSSYYTINGTKVGYDSTEYERDVAGVLTTFKTRMLGGSDKF